jgi:hypothetical protein
MVRNRNTDVNGEPFVDTTVLAVWLTGRLIEGFESATWRHDMCGQPMKYEHYGDTNSKHGWGVAHIKPVWKGGTDDLSNLRPLQWDNNRRNCDTYLWNCA